MYWEKPGRENTEKTFDLALKRAGQLGIQSIVVAANQGSIIKALLDKELKTNVVCVIYHVGVAEPGNDVITHEMRNTLEDLGIKMLNGPHLLAGIDQAARLKFQGVYPSELVAETLCIFGCGMKVAVEIACMALDAGLIPFGKEVVAIGGGTFGADTSAVILPAHSKKFFDTEVREIICMPRLKTVL